MSLIYFELISSYLVKSNYLTNYDVKDVLSRNLNMYEHMVNILF